MAKNREVGARNRAVNVAKDRNDPGQIVLRLDLELLLCSWCQKKLHCLCKVDKSRLLIKCVNWNRTILELF